MYEGTNVESDEYLVGKRFSDNVYYFNAIATILGALSGGLNMNTTCGEPTPALAGVEGGIYVDGAAATGILYYPNMMFDSTNDKTEEKSENKTETGNWNKGSFDSAEESLEYHYNKHGNEVGATSQEQYLRKAEEFSKTARKNPTRTWAPGEVEGVNRYKKNGKYIDIAPDSSIVSFGGQ